MSRNFGCYPQYTPQVRAYQLTNASGSQTGSDYTVRGDPNVSRKPENFDRRTGFSKYPEDIRRVDGWLAQVPTEMTGAEQRVEQRVEQQLAPTDRSTTSRAPTVRSKTSRASTSASTAERPSSDLGLHNGDYRNEEEDAVNRQMKRLANRFSPRSASTAVQPGGDLVLRYGTWVRQRSKRDSKPNGRGAWGDGEAPPSPELPYRR